MRRSAGAKFTVIRWFEKLYPELRIADLTRSLASCTGFSGRPTTLKAVSPWLMSTSTSTISPSRPITAQLLVFANIAAPNIGSMFYRSKEAFGTDSVRDLSPLARAFHPPAH